MVTMGRCPRLSAECLPRRGFMRLRRTLRRTACSVARSASVDGGMQRSVLGARSPRLGDR